MVMAKSRVTNLIGFTTILSGIFVGSASCMHALANPVTIERGAETSIAGAWQGSIAVQGLKLRIVLRFDAAPGGNYTGTFQSLDQIGVVMPLDVVTVKGSDIHFELKAADVAWDGKLNAAKTDLEGTWNQGGGSTTLNFKHTDKPDTAERPQDPKKPYPYVEHEVLYKNTRSGNMLGGTLTVPQIGGPFPAVILITGSGQQDRNEALLGHRPFLVIADYLTRRGIAVLRVDDRGIGKSTGDFSTATTADFATDVEAGILFLKSRKDINSAKIGLIGHSEGGVIGPMVAARNKDVAFVVMLAGTGVDGAKILSLQGSLIAKAAGAAQQTIDFNTHFQDHLFKIMAAESDPVKAEPLLNAAVKEEIAKLPEGIRTEVTQATAGTVKQMNSPWMRYFITYDPAIALQKVKCPVLAMNGEKDLQVPPTQNLPAIESALKAGGNTDFTIKLLPGMNHLFQVCKTGAPSEYSTISETISPIALQTMGDWIEKHTKP